MTSTKIRLLRQHPVALPQHLQQRRRPVAGVTHRLGAIRMAMRSMKMLAALCRVTSSFMVMRHLAE